MNATIAKELIEHVYKNINEDIPNVGVIKALLEDAVSYLEYPIVPESEVGPFEFDVERCDRLVYEPNPVRGGCGNKVCYCDGSCKNSINYVDLSSIPTCRVCGGKHYDPNFKCK